MAAKPKSKPTPKKPSIIKRLKMGKRGPARYAPTPAQRDLVEGMVAAGLTRPVVAGLLGMSPTTLREHFPDQLKNGDAKAIYRVAMGLYRNATTPTPAYPGGNVVAQIFWLKARAGWKETGRRELTGPDGQPIQHEHAAREILSRRIAGVAARKKAAGRALRAGDRVT